MSICKVSLSFSLLLAAASLAAGPAYASSSDSGQTLYAQSCAMCHGTNGKGAVPGAPDFTKPGGVLALSDKVLTERILDGYQAPGAPMAMPHMKGQVDKAQVHEILEYMHKAFGVPAAKNDGGHSSS